MTALFVFGAGGVRAALFDEKRRSHANPAPAGAK